MPINLHERARQRIQEILETVLANVVVFQNYSPVMQSLLPLSEIDNVLPSQGGDRERLQTIIGDRPGFEFFSTRIRSYLYPRELFVDEGEKKLTDIEEYSDISKFAKILLDEFESLPWKYCFHTMLPAWFDAGMALGEEIELGPNISICCYGGGIAESFPLDGYRKTYIFEDKPHHIEGFNPGYYIRIAIEGYVGYFGKSDTIKNSEYILRSFLGMGIAERYLRVSFRQPQVDRQRVAWIIHKKVGEKWTFDGVDALGDRLAKTISATEPLYTPVGVDKSEYTKKHINAIMAAFSDSEPSRRLQLAAQWLFDSAESELENDLLAFVQAMTVLEILLGDKVESDKLGLGELLKNRCAFLIGRNHAERNNILSKFPEIYRVRSNILHSGKNRFTGRDKELFLVLKAYCSRVIQIERRAILVR